MPYIVVTTTATTEDEALFLAQELVGTRLAACAQVVGPIRSVYRWQGNIESSSEYRVEFKTRLERFDDIQQFLAKIHPYDVPELIAVPVQDVSTDYAEWIDEALKDE